MDFKVCHPAWTSNWLNIGGFPLLYLRQLPLNPAKFTLENTQVSIFPPFRVCIFLVGDFFIPKIVGNFSPFGRWDSWNRKLEPFFFELRSSAWFFFFRKTPSKCLLKARAFPKRFSFAVLLNRSFSGKRLPNFSLAVLCQFLGGKSGNGPNYLSNAPPHFLSLRSLCLLLGGGEAGNETPKNAPHFFVKLRQEAADIVAIVVPCFAVRSKAPWILHRDVDVQLHLENFEKKVVGRCFNVKVLYLWGYIRLQVSGQNFW